MAKTVHHLLLGEVQPGKGRRFDASWEIHLLEVVLVTGIRGMRQQQQQQKKMTMTMGRWLLTGPDW